ncbi:ATP-binding protein [Arcobacter sp. LA11]|uniref:ATP-binding protein n=1 Tax=Arcobacter sp. LA11 TaxID=1898176 RepID=UPI000934C37D|nr:ATP-binding protein [Arcobacter sp. LA11]
MSNRLNVIIFSSVLLVILLFLSATILDTKYEERLFKIQTKNLEDSIKEEYKKRLKESIIHTIGFVDSTYTHYLKMQENLTNEKKEKLTPKFEELFIIDVKNYLYHNVFDKTRYTWVNKVINFEGGENYAIRLIHPNLKKTEGKLLSTKTKDIKGNFPYFEELEGVKKNEEIFFTYFFKQLNSDEITGKLSYAKLYKKLNWIIATGIPLNSLNKDILTKHEKLKKDYDKHIVDMYSFRIVIVILFIIILFFLRKKLNETLEENKKLNNKLEEKLKDAQTNLNKFFELPINLLVVTNLEGKILQINSGWSKILGYKKEELIDANFIDLIHSADKEKTLDEFLNLAKGVTTFYFENRYKHKNGSYKTLAWSANSIPENGLIYAAAHDITELKDKSNLIYQQSKMAAIGEMTANIAHQWRQPLSIISTASSGVLVKKMINDLDDKFLIDTMNQITESTQYLSDTIEDFRNFYSPNKEKSIFELDSLIEKTLNLLRKRFENDKIEIIINIDKIEINSYENELLQVIINLLNNARDQLIKTNIDKKLIFIDAYIKNNKIYVEITDNGEGIDEEILNRIFEPYFTTKEKSLGTGIGLYMSEEIVTKHLRGELYVKNTEYTYKNNTYNGAKFTIIIDLTK